MKINLDAQAKRDLKEVLKSNLMERFLELIVSSVENKDNPLVGIGSPEQLKGYNEAVYSRQLDKKNRIIYSYGEENLIILLSCIGHYDDK